MAYIKQRSNYMLQQKHQSTSNGTIWERDITTVGGLNSFRKDQYPIYQSGNFLLTINLANNTSKYIERYGWEENKNGTIWTLNDVADAKVNSGNDDNPIELKGDFHKLRDFAYYGSCVELIRSSINNIITNFPGEVCASVRDNVGKYVYYQDPNGEIEGDLILGGNKILLDNPFGIDMHTLYISEEEFSKSPNKYFAYNTSWKDNFYAIVDGEECEITSVNVEVLKADEDCSVINDVFTTTTIKCQNASLKKEYTFKVYNYQGQDNTRYYLTERYTKDGFPKSDLLEWSIRPLPHFFETFYRKLSVFEKMMINPSSSPKYCMSLEVMEETEYSYIPSIKKFTFPKSYGNYNISISSIEYSDYIDELVKIAQFHDDNFCDNLYRSLTHESIKNLDKIVQRDEDGEIINVYKDGCERMEKFLRLIAREFDEIKFYIDNLKNGNTISYDDVYNLPDYFYTDVVKLEGWDIMNVTPLVLSEYVVKNGVKYFRNILNGNNFDSSFEGLEIQSDVEIVEELNAVFSNDEPMTLGRIFAQDSSLKVTPYTSSNLKYKDGYFLLCDTCESETSNEIVVDDENIVLADSGYKIVLPNTPSETYRFDKCAKTVRPKIKQYASEREYTMEEVNNHFLKMLKLNSRALLRRKGTIDGMEMMLGLFGLRSKRYCEAMGLNEPYHYTIDERIAFSLGLQDYYDENHQMHLIDWYNSTKLIKYHKGNISYDIYTPYQGLPVDYISVDPNNEKSDRILFPYFSTNRTIDGNPYYQMNGGWLNKYPYQFDKHSNLISVDVIQETERNKTIFSETLNSVISVKNINDLFQISKDNIQDGLIAYVSNLSTDFIIIDDCVYEIKNEMANINGKSILTSYFEVEVLNHSVKLGSQVFFDGITISNIYLPLDELLFGQYINLKDLDDGYIVKIYIINTGEYTETYVADNIQDITNGILMDSPVATLTQSINNLGDEYTIEVKLNVHIPHIIAGTYKKNVANFGFFSGGTQIFITGDEEEGANEMLEVLAHPSHYFKLIDSNSKLEFGGLGWNQLDETDYDYQLANSITNYFNGNNPHRGNLKYDNGYEYITYFTRLFRYALEEELFNEGCYTDYNGMYMNELENIEKIGFPNLDVIGDCTSEYTTYPCSKISYFGNKYCENEVNTIRQYFLTPNDDIDDNLKGNNNFKIESYTLSDIDEYSFAKDIQLTTIIGQRLAISNVKNPKKVNNIINFVDENGNQGVKNSVTLNFDKEQEVLLTNTINGYGVTDQIVNTKVVEVAFNLYDLENAYSKSSLEITKYFDTVVIPYLTQMVPSNTILKIRYTTDDNIRPILFRTQYQTTTDNETIQLVNSEFDLGSIKNITINGKKVEVSDTYVFSEIGTHIVEYEMQENTHVLSKMFLSCKNLISFVAVDTQQRNTIYEMLSMFEKCENLKFCNLTHMYASNVYDMSQLFADCVSLQQVRLFKYDTTRLESISGMFKECKVLEEIDFGALTTRFVTNMSSLFKNCKILTEIDVTIFDTRNVTKMASMFEGCNELSILNLNHFNTTNVTDMSSMFSSCLNLKGIALSEWDTSNVVTMKNMFNECQNLSVVDVSNFATEKVTNMSKMFKGCKSLNQLVVDNFNTTNVTDMSSMFLNCRNLTTINCQNWNCKKVTTMANMFRNCTSLITGRNIGITSDALTNIEYLYDNCSAMKTVFVNALTLTNVTDMNYTFRGCSSVQSIEFGGYSMGSVTNIEHCFEKCTALNEVYINGQPPHPSTTNFEGIFNGVTTQGGSLYYNSSYEQDFKNGILKYIPEQWKAVAN